jgi:hypothetical protein
MRPVLWVWVLWVAPFAAAQSSAGEANRTIPAVDATAASPGGSWYLRLFSQAPPNPTPLTGKERLVAYVMSTVGPAPLFRAAATAAYEQGLHHPDEWRLGTSGYFRRVASQVGFNAVHQTLAYGIGSMLHEDNRYFPSGSTHFGPRLGHALLSTFTARRDGHDVFSVSSLAGVAGASVISRAWLPPSWRHGRNIGASIGFTWLGIAGYNVFREFLPRPK